MQWKRMALGFLKFSEPTYPTLRHVHGVKVMFKCKVGDIVRLRIPDTFKVGRVMKLGERNKAEYLVEFVDPPIQGKGEVRYWVAECCLERIRIVNA
jgi:hypothetical protein